MSVPVRTSFDILPRKFRQCCNPCRPSLFVNDQHRFCPIDGKSPTDGSAKVDGRKVEHFSQREKLACAIVGHDNGTPAQYAENCGVEPVRQDRR